MQSCQEWQLWYGTAPEGQWQSDQEGHERHAQAGMHCTQSCLLVCVAICKQLPGFAFCDSYLILILSSFLHL